MPWLKNALLDIAITLIIIAAFITGQDWLQFFVLVYAGIMLFMKIAVFRSDMLTQSVKKTERVPSWFNHLLYAIDVAVSLIAGWWLIAGVWTGIWLVSWLTFRRSSQPKTTPATAKQKKARN